MEYASAVWDPYYNSHIQQLEKIQGCATWWVYNNYNRFSSVSAMLGELSWPSLEIRRKVSRLQILHKVLNHQLAISIPSYYLQPTRTTRSYHPLHFIIPSSSTTSYQNSYFSRIIKEWITLPLNIIETTDFELFSYITFVHAATLLY